MTIARKYTRSLTVDGIVYRWMLKETDYGARFELLLVVESEERSNGEQLVGRLRAADRQETDAVTPGVVAEFIRTARNSGWDPSRRGSCPDCDESLHRLLRSRAVSSRE